MVKQHLTIITIFVLLLTYGCAMSELTQITDSTSTPTYTQVIIPKMTSTPKPMLSSSPTHILILTPAITTSTMTLTPTGTVENSDATETIIPGEYVYSSEQDCQKVPEPVLMDIDYADSKISLAGRFFLCRQWPLDAPLIEFDIDTGRSKNPGYFVNDIEFSVSYFSFDKSIVYNLRSINDAEIFDMGEEKPTFEDCLERSSRSEDFIIDGVDMMSACVLTTEGYLSRIQIERINPFGWGSIEISFVVWEK